MPTGAELGNDNLEAALNGVPQQIFCHFGICGPQRMGTDSELIQNQHFQFSATINHQSNQTTGNDGCWRVISEDSNMFYYFLYVLSQTFFVGDRQCIF